MVNTQNTPSEHAHVTDLQGGNLYPDIVPEQEPPAYIASTSPMNQAGSEAVPLTSGDHKKPLPDSPTHAPTPLMSPPVVYLPPAIPIEELRTEPAVILCPHCNTLSLTRIRHKNGAANWLSCIGMLLLGITALGVCLVPFCITSLKDVIHECGHCHQVVGKYKRI
ncbi:hypothetical protein BZG36_00044 [Bifiguratus adelaidae]|uniref:LITAF domain-containing protein n=1 Tax=Bifiguratus adelaidae TaxID=1938954 RepID=A0A261Y8D3_9FUNG|nr:hypothetical protein BZG36_00044 [Bifiguratus adelaidae]